MSRMRLAGALACAAGIIAAAPAGAAANVQVGSSGWEWGNPLPQGNTIRALSFAANRGYAAGDFGTLLRTEDGGTTWTGLPAGTYANLTEVQAVDADTVVAGGGCVARRSDDGGRTFSRVPFTPVESSCREPLAALFFTTERNGYVVLADGTVLQTTDGGQSYAQRSAIPGTRSPGGSASPDRRRGSSPTPSASPRRPTASSSRPSTAATRGRSSTTRTAPCAASRSSTRPGATPSVTAASSCARPTAGRPGRRSTPARPARTSRRSAARPTSSASRPRARATRSCARPTAARRSRSSHRRPTRSSRRPSPRRRGSSRRAGRDDGRLRRRGPDVRPGRRAPDGPLQRASRRRSRGGTAYAPGDNGSLARTTDGGRTWQRGNVPTSEDILDVAFPTADDGYALDVDGGLFRTSNGGGAWKTLDTGSTARPSSVYASSPNVVMVIGPTGMRRSTDGGGSFTAVTSKAAARARVYSVDRAGSSVFAYGNRVLIRSGDGGRTWLKVRTPKVGIRRADFVDARNGFLLDDRRPVYRTRNGGRTWTELPGVGTRDAYGMAFSSASRGYLVIPSFGDVSQRSGFLLRTTDGGSTWHPQFVVSDQISATGIAAPGGGTDYLLGGDASLLASRAGGDAGGASELTITTRRRAAVQARGHHGDRAAQAGAGQRARDREPPRRRARRSGRTRRCAPRPTARSPRAGAPGRASARSSRSGRATSAPPATARRRSRCAWGHGPLELEGEKTAKGRLPATWPAGTAGRHRAARTVTGMPSFGPIVGIWRMRSA